MLEEFFLTSSDSIFYAYQSSYDLSMVLASVSIAIFVCFCAIEMVERLARSTSRVFWLPMGSLMLGVGVWSMHFIGMLAFRLDCDVTYDPWVTAYSVIPGILAASVALNSMASNDIQFGKRVLGGLTMGAGIGLMHFTGMAAIRLDGILRYDPYLFSFSLCAALLLAIAALFVSPLLKHLKIGCNTLMPSAMSSIVLGSAISGMHYIAMEAAHFIHSHPNGDETVIVATSPILLAIVVMAVALLLIISGVQFTYLSVKIASIRTHIETILTTTSQGFVVINQHGLIDECNPAMAKLLHKNLNELIGNRFANLIKSPLNYQIEDNFQHEAILLRSDGSDLPCMIHGNTVYDDHGETLYQFALISDISQKKQQEQKLQESERRLLDILDVSPIAVRIATDQGRRVVFFNQRYADLIGTENTLGQDLKHYYANQRDYFDILAQLGNGKTILNRQIELLVPGKAAMWVLASYMPMIYQEQPAVLGWFYDISDRIEAQHALTRQLETQLRIEESLRMANAEQQAIFDSASSGIALIKKGVIERCNQQLSTLFGYENHELTGQDVALWFADDDDSQRLLQRLTREMYATRIKRQECLLQRKQGERFWARLAGQALNQKNAHDGVVVIVEDITLERAATEEILKAKNLAEEATKIKSDFLANMSHEIRTPMNAIIGFTHLLLRHELTPRQTEYLQKIHASSQHLLGIINDILDFSKIEAGKMIIEHINFDLEELMSNVSGLISDKAAEKNLELIFNVAPNVPLTLVGDPLRLGQILINFTTNAIKFTEKGEITISVHKLQDTDKGSVLKFSVKDTGIGLDQQQIDRLFQSFQQADSSITRKYGGTGLGLAICRNLALIMGGDIGVYSEPGLGSEFWFTAQLEQGIEHHRRKLTAHPDLRGKHMLVVDDNENARTVVSGLLESMSFNVKVATSGQLALDAIRQHIKQDDPFDAIFIDWQMPNMDGIEVARNIKGMGLTQEPKLILVTAYGREQVLHGAIQAGFDEIILKPVNASSLFDSIARAFGKDADITSPSANVKEDYPIDDLASLAGACILLVEDNEMNQQIATELLQHAGFVVDLAVNGLEAVDKVQHANYHLVLMDMQMPVMDGITATCEIRKLPQMSQLPIVAMTANAMSQDRDRCLEAGMNDYLPKPIEPDDLWQTLRKWINPGLITTPFPSSKSVTPPPILGEFFNDVEGLDTSLGLRRVQGKQDLYMTLLHNFIDKQAVATEDIHTAWQQGDNVTAERIAHTLKGLAGNIGATPLQTSATRLETALREQQSQPDIEPLLADTATHLQSLITALRNKLADESTTMPAPVSGDIDQPTLDSVLSRLITLLQENDAGAIDYFASHTQILQTTTPELFASLKESIEDFAFDAALTQLIKLKS